MQSDESLRHNSLKALAAGIVAAYVRNHVVSGGALVELISGVHAALEKTKRQKTVVARPLDPLKPAVPIRKSVTDEFLISLEDGKPYRALKRHLNAKYNMTPDEYRMKWGLPHDYPMVAPMYAQKKAELARSQGLGQRRTKA